MKLLCTLLFAAALAWATDTPRIVYTKIFPNSTPPYAGITLERNGLLEYRESADDQSPYRAQMSQQDADAIFALADKLDRFARPLESNLKVANMGMKTFRYEGGSGTHEVKFNYSLDPDARLLADWFERIIETEQNRARLDQAMHFDKLGVNNAVLQLEISMDHKRLVAPDQFLPLLDRIAKNESFLHMARERAARLADTIRAQNPKSE